MSQPDSNHNPVTPGFRNDRSDAFAGASTGQLVSQISEQLSVLVRDELRLAQLELQQKAKKAGLGAGLFGGAGTLVFYGVGALIAAAILGLAAALPAWLAALIVGVVVLAVAGLLTMGGAKEVRSSTPPIPTEAVTGVKTDVETVKEGLHR